MAITKVKTLGITDANVTAAKLATDSVETAKITAANVTNAKLGTDISAAKLTAGTVPDARFPATLPAASGANLTNLNATNLGSGTVPTARLGTGTADSSVFLAGNNTWASAGGGKIGQVISCTPVSTAQTTTSTSFEDVTGVTVSITPAATTSKVLIMATLPYVTPTSTRWGAFTILRDTTNLGDATYVLGRINDQTSGSFAAIATYHYLDSPSTTSATTYKVQFRTQDASYSFGSSFEDAKAIITVMEVLA